MLLQFDATELDANANDAQNRLEGWACREGLSEVTGVSGVPGLRQ